jgi:hypothetical protein
MRRRFTSRPAPIASAVAAVVGVFVLILAIIFLSQVKNTPGPMLLFLAVWFVLLIGGIGYHLMNAARPGGVPTQIIEGEDEVSGQKSSSERLQELEDLRTRKLISDTEYEIKRQEILKQL